MWATVFLSCCPFFYAQNLSANETQDFHLGAKIPGLMGSSDHLYLRENQLYIQPFYNDFIGNTDKFLTNEALIGYVGRINHSNSFDLRLDWRVVTPAVQFKHGDPINKDQIGVYADWLSMEGAFANIQNFSPTTSVKVQFHAGLGIMQNLGVKGLQNILHDSLGRSTEKFTFNPLLKRFYYNLGLEVGLQKKFKIFSKKQMFETLVRNQFNSLFTTIELESNLVANFYRSATINLQYKLIRHVSSDVFSGVNDWHHEAAFGLKVWKNWTPSVRYVSPYLKADKYRQLYLDFIGYNF